MLMNRSRAADLGQETVRILETGRYATPDGEYVEIGDLVKNSVRGTVSYPPDAPLPAIPSGSRPTTIEVKNESTLAAAQRLAESGHRPVALNFASAKHPGGGFLGGARAQEESLARSSGLYSCIVGNPMYGYHLRQADPMYTSYAIHSPDVPVIRSDDGTLLARPYLCSFITCAAVNAKVVLERSPSRRPEIRQAMQDRVRRVLAIAAAHQHEDLVLGAWGCGVFGNDCQEIAEAFQRALADDFRGVFAQVTFAILDWSQEHRFIGPFLKAFATAK